MKRADGSGLMVDTIYPEPLPATVVDGRCVFSKDCVIAIAGIGGGLWSRYEMKGLWWDRAPIPRWAWSIVGDPLSPELQWASLVYNRGWVTGAGLAEERRITEAVFFEILSRSGVPWWRRQLMRAALKFCPF